MQQIALRASRYPQRLEWQERPWLDRLWDVIATRAHRYFAAAKWRQYWFVRRVMAAQARLESLDTAESRKALQTLRLALRREGVTDRHLAECFAHVRLQTQQVLGVSHYPVQIRGGYLMARGLLVEMDTGEGKTLTATLPAAAMALAGYRVQVITVNDYLAARDAAQLSPVYARLGLRCAVVREDDDEAAHRDGFAADICYCTGKTLAFDYLRDRMALGDRLSTLAMDLDGFTGRWQQNVRLPGLQFALIDEADSILVDEARTPLIIAATADQADVDFYARAIELARALRKDEDFIEAGEQQGYDLTGKGRERLADWCAGLGGAWSHQAQREYAVCRALLALHGFRRDVHYIIDEDAVVIVDEQTGRVMPDRSWEAGMHQLIELKEDVPVTAQRQTLARISYQLFFQRFLHLAGMSGTAREVAHELIGHYGLPVVRIPPHRRSQRANAGRAMYASQVQKWQAVVERCEQFYASGRAVLVGTRSIESAEALAVRMREQNIPYQLLHARQDAEEAGIIARAGQPGQITIATNMAGRGTDIALHDAVRSRGGLHVILTEGHESRRIDRQLIGRCARQGEPGSYEMMFSLEDDLLKDSQAARWLALREHDGLLPGIWQPLAWGLYRAAQRRLERRHRRVRAQLLRTEYRLRRSLSFTGRME